MARAHSTDFLHNLQSMKPVFNRIIRFRDPKGQVWYGEAPQGDDFLGQMVSVYDGSSPWDPSLKATGQRAEITEVREQHGCNTKQG